MVPLSRWLARRGDRSRAWIAAGAGAASALALPPIHAVPVLLFTVPCLVALLGLRRTFGGAAATGLYFGLAHHIVGLYWITDAILIEAARFWWLVPLAVPALSFVLALFIAAGVAVAWLAPPGWRRAAALAGGWVLFDLLRQFLATGFPWNPWGSVWVLPGLAGDVMLQPASLVGVHGLTLATLLLAATPSMGRQAMLAGATALAAWVGFGAWRLSLPVGADQNVVVVLLQGDIAQGQKWDRPSRSAPSRPTST